jgi:Protein of unknown function (DUF2510)
MRHMKPLGITTFLVGGLTAAASPFLHYVGDLSLWHSTVRYPLILTILVVVAMVLAVASLAVDRWFLPALAGLLSAFVLGEAFPLLYASYHFQLGFWLLTAGALVMTASSLLALTGSIAGLRRAERRAGIAFASDVGGESPEPLEAGDPAIASGGALPPSGWYADPAGVAQERFWSGEAWTEKLRG